MLTHTLTLREREQVDAANSADGPAVVLLHELWALVDAWEPWRDRLGEHGFTTVAVEWPREPETFEEALADPDAVAGVSLADVREHAAMVVGALRERPLLVGHGVGALTAQQLAGKGLARATVAIAPAPMKGSTRAPDSMLQAAAPVLRDPQNRDRAIRLTFPEFRYAYANAVNVDEARTLWETRHVPGSARVGFELASLRRDPRAPASVDTVNRERGPMLVVSAGRSRLVDPAISAETFRIQSRNPCETEFLDLPDRGHTLLIDSGWAEVADHVIAYLERQR
ncbi:alpha/beta hydrolase [Demequina sp. SYSU T00192]|uniref:Alpha/beta hydrolase n=1 Tax=Demequina litoralis TaxID=3051660 RepID=A0ABT8GAT2_9MICO|nr:alpha/beta hydrolase [Demequina sp. SYSU T00192]MDN4476251.1 alpha/beta hydrolase [Demequina sp. SYSU T00192]